MDKIEFSCEVIKGQGLLTFPRSSLESILDVIAKVEKRLPRSSRPDIEVELMPGSASVKIIDQRAMDNRGRSVTEQHGIGLVENLKDFTKRKAGARKKGVSAVVNPGDELLEALNGVLHQAKQNKVTVGFRDDTRHVAFEAVDPEDIHVKQPPLPPEDIQIDCVCAGARVVSVPDGQLELFPRQAVEQRFFLYSAPVEEVRFTGPLLTAWSAKAFACRIRVSCQRARPDHKYATALEAPIFTDLEPDEI